MLRCLQYLSPTLATSLWHTCSPRNTQLGTWNRRSMVKCQKVQTFVFPNCCNNLFGNLKIQHSHLVISILLKSLVIGGTACIYASRIKKTSWPWHLACACIQHCRAVNNRGNVCNKKTKKHFIGLIAIQSRQPRRWRLLLNGLDFSYPYLG